MRRFCLKTAAVFVCFPPLSLPLSAEGTGISRPRRVASGRCARRRHLPLPAAHVPRTRGRRPRVERACRVSLLNYCRPHAAFEQSSPAPAAVEAPNTHITLFLSRKLTFGSAEASDCSSLCGFGARRRIPQLELNVVCRRQKDILQRKPRNVVKFAFLFKECGRNQRL